LNGLYRIHEFAALAGVTAKALRHYDRLGLLKPARTAAGYRMYSGRDLERLEQIVALKFIGLPLKDIAAVLDQTAFALPQALRAQRRVLEEKQRVLERALAAIGEAERSLEDPSALKKIIEVINMQDGIEFMKQYYGTEESWERRRRYYEEGPSQEWRDLYRDIGAALDEDPGSEKAQTLADRWFTLWLRASQGDPDIQIDSLTAWSDRAHWPPVMKQRIAEFNLEKVMDFIVEAGFCATQKYFTAETWTDWRVLMDKRIREMQSPYWQDQIELFREMETSRESDRPQLAARWMAILDRRSGGNPQIKEALLKIWADRKNWNGMLRWREEAYVMMTGDRFEKVASLFDDALLLMGR
jgi:DNA-binding transcriptional MerR regulator